MRFCDYGYVLPDGRTRFEDRGEGFSIFEKVGEMRISEELSEELHAKSLEERRRFFGIQ
jgi:hypothetical protein